MKNRGRLCAKGCSRPSLCFLPPAKPFQGQGNIPGTRKYPWGKETSEGKGNITGKRKLHWLPAAPWEWHQGQGRRPLGQAGLSFWVSRSCSHSGAPGQAGQVRGHGWAVAPSLSLHLYPPGFCTSSIPSAMGDSQHTTHGLGCQSIFSFMAL